MPKIAGGGKGDSTLVGCKVNDVYLSKIDAMLENRPAPFASRSDFVYSLIVDYFGKEEAKERQKEAILEFIRNDPDIKQAIRSRAMEILAADLAEAKKQ